MHLSTDSPFKELITKLEKPEHLDLDELRRKLLLLSARWGELHERATLYESEFQRELRSKIDLCGGIPGCPEAGLAETLTGEELLSARCAASLQFNRVFCMAPMTRDQHQLISNQERKNSRNHFNDVRLRAQKNL